MADRGLLRRHRARPHAARAATASRSAPTCGPRGDWTPILVLTAKDGELDEAEALDTGADDYLAKPFSYHVLVARLRALARRTSTRRRGPGRGRRPAARPRPPAVPGGATRSWPSRHGSSTCSSASCAPPARCSPSRTSSPRVWDDDFEGDPNIVEVYIAPPAPEGRRALRAPVDRDAPRLGLPAGRRCRLTATASGGSAAA